MPDQPSLAQVLKSGGSVKPILSQREAAQRMRSMLPSDDDKVRNRQTLGQVLLEMTGVPSVRRFLQGGYVPGRQSASDAAAIEEAFNAAGLAGTGAYMTPKPRGSIGAGGGGKGFTAYHGSPHDFDKFDMSKIGTGEGAQAYGRGLYFAENESVARAYRDNLTTPPDYFPSTVKDEVGYEVMQAVRNLRQEDPKYSIDELRDAISALTAIDKLPAYSGEAFDDLVRSGHVVPPGRMYEVRINADPEDFLDWDAPRDALSPRVAQWAQKEAPDAWENAADGASLYSLAERAAEQLAGPGAASRMVVAQELRDAGVPGIKFYDQGSRGTGEGTRNYVLFRDDIIEIVRKYGIAAAVSTYGADAVMQATQGAEQ